MKIVKYLFISLIINWFTYGMGQPFTSRPLEYEVAHPQVSILVNEQYDDPVSAMAFDANGNLAVATNEVTEQIDRAGKKVIVRKPIIYIYLNIFRKKDPVRPSHSLEGHDRIINTLAFHNDLLLSGSKDKTIKMWNIRTKENLATLKMNSIVNAIAANPKNNEIAVGLANHKISIVEILRDPARLNQQRLLVGHLDQVTSVAFSPNGIRLVSGSLDRTIRIWVPASDKELERTLLGKKRKPVKMPRNAPIATVRKIKKQLKDKPVDCPVQSVMFNPKSNELFISGGSSKIVQKWDLSTDMVFDLLGTHPILTVAYNNRGNVIAAGSKYKGPKRGNPQAACAATPGSVAQPPLHVWIKKEKTLFMVPLFSRLGHHGDVNTVAFDPVTGRLASGGTRLEGDSQVGGEIFIWDIPAIEQHLKG